MPRLFNTVRISHIKPTQQHPYKIPSEVVELTNERLIQYWNETADKLNLKELMEQAIPKVSEQSGIIEIDAQTVSFHEDFRPHRIDVMECLRQKTNMPVLDCKVNQLYLEQDAVIYNYTDKYNLMLEKNPAMSALRNLFPQIDY